MSLETVLEKITAQQPREHSAVWMVGEQLKDMLRAEPHLVEIVSQDLDVAEMSLAECEKKIKACADKHKTGNFSCVTPAEAEGIIREFYGLPDAGQAPKPEPAGGNLLRLEDFF